MTMYQLTSRRRFHLPRRFNLARYPVDGRPRLSDQKGRSVSYVFLVSLADRFDVCVLGMHGPRGPHLQLARVKDSNLWSLTNGLGDYLDQIGEWHFCKGDSDVPAFEFSHALERILSS